jgi:hypothetical protein
MAIGGRGHKSRSVTTGPQIHGLAMPQGPTVSEDSTFKTSGFAQAADFYDSVGINHHSDYMGAQGTDAASDATAAVTALAELGIRHIRGHLWSPATHATATTKLHRFVTTIQDHATYNGYFIWGTPAEPQYRATNGSGSETHVYRIGTPSESNPDDTYFRPLDGRTGIVGSANWPSGSPYYPNELKYSAGTFHDFGWETAAALQGPNEPDERATYYETSIRNEVMARLKAARDARPTEIILGGNDYIDSLTGRITPGPAYATQLPIVGPPFTTSSFASSNWTRFGDYTQSGEIDVAARHQYHQGFQPRFRRSWEKDTDGTISSGPRSTGGVFWPGEDADRYKKRSYNGSLTGGLGLYVGELPYMMTETGWPVHPSWPNQDRVHEAIAGEYLIRVLIQNYLAGCRRTYIYKLNDENTGPPFNLYPSGLTNLTWGRYACFYAVKNLMTLVGFVQGATTQPITVTNSFTATINDHNEIGLGGHIAYDDGGGWTADGLRQLVLQRNDGYLVILSRDRLLWDPHDQALMSVADPKPVTVTFSGTFSSVSRAVPALNTVETPNLVDGQNYGWTGDPGGTNGTIYQPWPKSGNTFQTTMAGLTQVFKLTP